MSSATAKKLKRECGILQHIGTTMLSCRALPPGDLEEVGQAMNEVSNQLDEKSNQLIRRAMDDIDKLFQMIQKIVTHPDATAALQTTAGFSPTADQLQTSLLPQTNSLPLSQIAIPADLMELLPRPDGVPAVDEKQTKLVTLFELVWRDIWKLLCMVADSWRKSRELRAASEPEMGRILRWFGGVVAIKDTVSSLYAGDAGEWVWVVL
jgi:hypothetical protein